MEIKRCMHCDATETPQWRQGPTGPKTLCNACGVRWGRELAAAGHKKKPLHKKTATNMATKRKASSPLSYRRDHKAYTLPSDDQEASLICPEEESGGSEIENLQLDFDCLAALNLMAMTTPHSTATAPAQHQLPASLAIVPDELLTTILPHLTSQEVINLKKHCEAYDAACIEAEAAEAAIKAVEQVLDQRREAARIKGAAARFASETLFHEARKLSSLASLINEPPLHHHSSPRKCHSPKRSPF